MSESDVIDRTYRAIGGARELFLSEDREVLCESGAMTGKSLSLLRKADFTARKHPGCRQFFARDTRKSMNESILVEWESGVLWPGHPAITGTATKEHRDSYTYPNGSVIVLTGLDNPDRVMSTQFDRGYVFEATETTLDDWEKLLTRLRYGRTPYHQLVADCNPGSEFHWLNLRFPKEGEPNPTPVYNDGQLVSSRRRIYYRHEDNPRLYNSDGTRTTFGQEYIGGTLGSLSGARRARLLEHKWASEEGQVWPEYDPPKHCVVSAPELKWYVASIDFGYNAPGCMQVWGFDADKRAYRVAEVYQDGVTIDRWAEAAIQLRAMFPFQRGVGDAARPDDIALLNKRLRIERGEEQVFERCDKSRGVLHGIDMVRDALRSGRMYFVKDAHWYFPDRDTGALVRGVDKRLREKAQPQCTEQEIPSYVFRKREDGREIKDEPDPSCADHGCDATRYLTVFTYSVDLTPQVVEPLFPRGSYGDLLDFQEEMENWE